MFKTTTDKWGQLDVLVCVCGGGGGRWAWARFNPLDSSLAPTPPLVRTRRLMFSLWVKVSW